MDTKINFEKFEQVDLQVGEITEASRIEKSNKLIKLQVDLGEQSPRQIVAGIAPFYAEEGLEGKQVVVVANLEPAELMGERSNGMVLCAHNEENEKCSIVTPEEEMELGTKVL